MDAADGLLGAQQRDAAARHDAFLHRGAGGVEGVLDAILLLLHLDLGRAADANDRDAAGELGQTLLQLLAVVVRGGLLDLRLDLADAGFDVLFLAGAADDRGVFLVDHDLAGAAEHVDRHAFGASMPLEDCRINIDLDGDTAVIRCSVSVHHKTGVEMEALTGASIAALTVYDMCKALSHDIVIGDLRLLAKDGGKSRYVRETAP